MSPLMHQFHRLHTVLIISQPLMVIHPENETKTRCINGSAWLKIKNWIQICSRYESFILVNMWNEYCVQIFFVNETKLKINMIRKSCCKREIKRNKKINFAYIKNDYVWNLIFSGHKSLCWLLRFHIWTGWLLVECKVKRRVIYGKEWLRHKVNGNAREAEKKIKTEITNKK